MPIPFVQVPAGYRSVSVSDCRNAEAVSECVTFTPPAEPTAVDTLVGTLNSVPFPTATLLLVALMLLVMLADLRRRNS